MQIHIFIRPLTKNAIYYFLTDIFCIFQIIIIRIVVSTSPPLRRKSMLFSAYFAVNTQLFLRVNRDFRKMKPLSL